MRGRMFGAAAGLLALVTAVAVAQVFSTGGATKKPLMRVSKLAVAESAEATPGEGPAGTLDDYLAAQHAYPADSVPPAVAVQAEATFEALAKKDAKTGDPKAEGHKWKLVGPTENATQPGVTSFSGATNNTASRTVALAISPDCGAKGKSDECRLWAGTSGGGVWRTDHALSDNPDWKQLGEDDLDQNSVGALVLDPTDKKADTLFLGTGEGNRCSSGCEAGAGLYRSTDGGNHWKQLSAACVSNATYACVNPGKNSFLGRGINGIVIDPRNANHIFVGSAQAVRGLSHTIGNGGTTRLEPGANAPGLYESTDGGATFTMVWNGNRADSFGVTDVGIDPLNLDVVYAAAFEEGVWRRDAGAAPTAFSQVFAGQFKNQPTPGNPTNRTMFALTAKNNKTRIYLTDGTSNSGGILGPLAAQFWRTDNANQPAAALLASQAAGAAEPSAANVFPATYNGWQKLTSQDRSSPFFATDDFCTGQCWYDQDVYTPAGMPDTVYVLGSFLYGELPNNTKGVGSGNNRSNGRGVLYSDTAGDPDPAHNLRTFTDMTYDAQNEPAPWCALGGSCLVAPNGIHPDQHEIVINPSNPTQFFESSDGGVVRTEGTFKDTSADCTTTRAPAAVSQLACQRLISRIPTKIAHIDKHLGSTLQFINVAINPGSTCEVMGGTQDNGTWSNSNDCDNQTWTQVIYGDGGNAGYDSTNPTWRFNEFTSGASDSNFRNGEPTMWVITSAPVVRSGEGAAFYWPQIADPNPAPGAHPIFSGAKHVWRTWAFGAGHPRTVPQDKVPDIAFYESHCQEFTVSSADINCGDYMPLGGPYCENPPTPPAPATSPPAPACIDQPGNLTGAVYGAATDRGGGSISFLARVDADHGTLWAATGAGRLFVTHNADAADPAAVVWHRIDNPSSPTRFPSGIYVDPANPSHAWVSYSGYNANTPSTPGHVFSVLEGAPGLAGSGIFTNLHVENGGTSSYPTPFSDGDLPVSDVVRDDANHILYVGTDFGVLRGDDDGAEWHVTAGMPRYEVMHLEIQPSSRVATCAIGGKCKRTLYAATHSQGIWQMKLEKDAS